MKKRNPAQQEKKAFVLSALQGVLIAAVLSIQYALPDLTKGNTLAIKLDALQLWLDGYGFIWSLMAVLLTGFIYFTKKQSQERSVLLWIISGVFGVLNVCGLMMFYLDDLPFFESFTWLLFTAFLAWGWALLFHYVAYWVLLGFTKISNIRHIRTIGEDKRNRRLFACLIFLCWLPWMIVYYPASMDWDVYRQLSSALGYGYWARSNHDPWLASCILAGFYKLGVALGSQNLGIFLFVLVRNLVISAIYGGCVARLYRSGVQGNICIGALLFYAVTPVWGAYAKHGFKDTLATAVFCAYMLSLITVVLQSRKNQLTWKDCIGYVIAGAAAALLRNNFVYAIAPVTGILVLWLLVRKTDWKKSLVLLLAVLIYLGFNHYIFTYGGVREGSSREALSVLFQQTARTVKYHGDELSEEQKQAIDTVLDYDSMAEKYDPLVSDPIKDRWKGGSPIPYIKTWAGMLFQHPDTYIEATIGGSYGYYAFTPKHPVGAGNWNSGMTIFDWIKVPAFDEFGFDFSYIEGMQPARDALHKWTQIWDSLPVLSLTDTIAVYTWLVVLLGYWLLRNKRWPELIVILAPCILILTCIASPVNDAFRYYSPVAASLPALLLLLPNSLIQNNTCEEEKNG